MTDNFWEDRNVFVTGATGFLGSYLVRDLVNKGANVIVLVYDKISKSNFYRFGLDKKTTIINGSVTDYLLLKRALNEYEIDTIFHLAAQAIVGTANRSPLSTFNSNVKGTWNLLEAARQNELTRGVVIASSDKAYGSQEQLPYHEGMPLQGEHPYDVSKSCADLIGLAYHKTYGLPVNITRSGNFYGGGDLNFNRIIPDTIRSVIRDKAPIIRSDGTFIRDYIYIEDVSGAYLKIAKSIEEKKIGGEAFNISTDKKHAVVDVVNLILQLMNSNLKPEVLNIVKAEIKDQYLSSEKIKAALNWQPQHTLEEGLKKTIPWYEVFLKNGS